MHQQSPFADIGAGTLGWQIALKFAFRGIEVRLQDAFPEALTRGVALIEAEIAAVTDSGDSAAESIDVKSRIIACESLASAVDGAWLVIEEIPERLELKRRYDSRSNGIYQPQSQAEPGNSSAEPNNDRLLRHVWQKSRFYRDLYSDVDIRKSKLEEVALTDLPIIGRRRLGNWGYANA